MMGTGSPRFTPSTATSMDADVNPLFSRVSSPDYEVEEPTEAEMFSRLMKPRVRYDVEVVTKLIVYSGR